VGQEAKWLTLPVRRVSGKRAINQRLYMLDDEIRESIMRRLKESYRSAPFFRPTIEWIGELIGFDDPNVAAFNEHLLRRLGEAFGIPCAFVRSSEVGMPPDVRGQEKVIATCKCLGATSYVNSIGGVRLYDAARFALDGLDLGFVETEVAPTVLDSGPQHLSIIDGLMHQGLDALKNQLGIYRRVAAA